MKPNLWLFVAILGMSGKGMPAHDLADRFARYESVIARAEALSKGEKA